jgi:Ca-activated chloride channel family protein
MAFRWPLSLLLLGLVPALGGIYLWQLRRRRSQAFRHSHIALVRAAVPARSRWKRHVPVCLFVTAVASLAVASARPNAEVKVPLDRTSIILALDVSRSMCATDVTPNRLAVAQDAARAFVENQPDGTRVGLVAFAGFAEVVVAPTKDRDALVAAIDGLTTARGTVIGTAILKSIDAIATVNLEVPPVGAGTPGRSAPTGPSGPTGTGGGEPAPGAAGGGYVPDIVVLLTDGANTRGVEPAEAATAASQRRVRVYTIGFGTANPTAMVCSSQQLGGDAFGDTRGSGFGPGGLGGPNGGGPPRQFLVIDEPTLQQVAEVTGGAYYRAEDADQLQQVFEDLPRQIDLQTEEREISILFGGIGLALAALAIALSLRWNPGI